MTPQERSEYNTLFKNILISICGGLNLQISCDSAMLQKYGITSNEVIKILTNKPIISPNILVNSVEYLNKHYIPYKHDGTVNPILFDPSIGNKIWEYADNIFDTEKEKDAFFTYFKDCNQSHYSNNFRQIIYNAKDEKFFKFFKSSISDTNTFLLNDFKSLFTLLKNRSFETPEQKDALFLFTTNFKKIIKRPDIKPAFCDFIAQKLPENQHAPYAKILGRNILLKLETFPEDIMSSNASQTLSLKKDKLFERIKFKGASIATVPILNDINNKLAATFNLKIIKEKLGLVDTHFVEFMAAHNRGKITFAFTSENHRQDMPIIYMISLQSCALNYSFKAQDYNEIVEKTINHYLLEQNLPEKTEKSILTRKI